MRNSFLLHAGLALLLGFAVAARAADDVADGGTPLGLALVDLGGAIHQLGDCDGCKAVVLVFLSPECPVSNQYGGELNRIHEEAGRQKVEFYGVVSDAKLSRSAIKKHYDELAARFPVFVDSSGLLTELCRPTHVPEAFVFASDGRLAYRGRIDDAVASVDARRGAVVDRTLASVIAAIAEDRSPAAGRTEPVGTRLEKGPVEPITYTRHVAPLLFARCVQCHRPGEVAPFSLLTYDDAAKRAGFLAEITAKGIMPPWHARPQGGEFRGERRLGQREIKLLDDWAKAGAPEGDADDLPSAPRFAEGWRLGQPDLVLKMGEAYHVPAGGADVFRFFVIPIEIPEDRVVAAVEFRPGNPRVVHHSIMYLDSSGVARKRDAADPAPGYEGFVTGGFRPSGTLGFWAPGYTPRYLPEGIGLQLRKGTDLAMQLHYHPSGKEETDQSQVGVYFTKRPVSRYLSGIAMINFDVDIPPGERRHRMEQSFTTPVDIELLDITPHMHMIGTEMKVVATLPDGSTRPLVWSQWNFNWQEQYLYRRPVRLPAGTRIDLEAWYDNSAENPYNPNRPPKRVTFGEMTTDEMCICALAIAEDAPTPRRELQRALQKSMMVQLDNPKVLSSLLEMIRRGTPPGEKINFRELFGGLNAQE